MKTAVPQRIAFELTHICREDNRPNTGDEAVYLSRRRRLECAMFVSCQSILISLRARPAIDAHN